MVLAKAGLWDSQKVNRILSQFLMEPDRAGDSQTVLVKGKVTETVKEKVREPV